MILFISGAQEGSPVKKKPLSATIGGNSTTNIGVTQEALEVSKYNILFTIDARCVLVSNGLYMLYDI